MPIPSTRASPSADHILLAVLGGPGRRCVVLMNQSSRDHTLLDVRPSPGPGRGAVSPQSSRDKRRKRSLPGSTVRKEGRAISAVLPGSAVVPGSSVVVVGDVLLDLDVHGTVERLCPDAPVPVLDVTGEVARPGGAGLAAAL